MGGHSNYGMPVNGILCDYIEADMLELSLNFTSQNE